MDKGKSPPTTLTGYWMHTNMAFYEICHTHKSLQSSDEVLSMNTEFDI